MLTINTDSGKSRGGSNDLQNSDQLDPQVIQEYRERYLQIAWKVQGLMSMPVLYTYDQLYRHGCDHPKLSERIDALVSLELRLSGYSKDDQVNILLYGPYIQAQMLDHSMSESGARDYIRQRLAIAPTPPAPLKELSQIQVAPTTAA
ncbi:hypothetical protein [Acaryochloris marina]|uniref:Uncharacterized protein n=1 Tax=Acaryochloris marina (strain MBIC 11017) TaxID=329726 RepID=A8ZMD8_ACAM1|nr:hypothetical protein [Acaryochloris marina]ABW32349.1 hypothetical protein AM1_C0039 [Acaryochloris marina MBIC11017]